MTRKNEFGYLKPIILDEFQTLYEGLNGEIQHKPERFEFLFFDDVNTNVFFKNHAEKIIQSIGKRYLPIYRMGDGEFNLLKLYFKLPCKTIIKKVKSNLKTLLIKRNFYGTVIKTNHFKELVNLFSYRYVRTCTGETIYQSDFYAIKERLIRDMKKISNNGYIAPNFNLKGSYANDLYPVFKWFRTYNVPLNAETYFPCYMVYALLNSKYAEQIYSRKNILIITNLNSEREFKIKNTLNKYGAKSVQFYQISAYRAMFDTIDLSKIKAKIDLVLVGAGIGSINILTQLEPLKTVCIDAGFVIETFVDPKLKLRRIYLCSDADYKQLILT